MTEELKEGGSAGTLNCPHWDRLREAHPQPHATADAGEVAEFEPLLQVPMTHTRSCPQLTPGEDDSCTCGLSWRVRLATEMTLHNAWVKRANEAEAECTRLAAQVAERDREIADLQQAIDANWVQHQRVVRAEAEAERNAKDAERYRVIRRFRFPLPVGADDTFDAAIDAALESRKP